jgi:hypothetical protein
MASRITVIVKEGNNVNIREHYLAGGGCAYSIKEGCIIVFDTRGSSVYPINTIKRIDVNVVEEE